MDQSLKLSIREEEFIFDRHRTIYWPNKKVMLATDLHWGKSDYFQKHGIAVPDQVFDNDLKRLSQTLGEYEVDTLLILGDLIHHEKSMSHGLIERVAHFRHEHPCELLLIKGNHDRYAQFPESWGVVEEKDFSLGEFYFTHELTAKKDVFQFAGHHHPVMRFRAGSDQLRLPIFLVDETYCLLPAFSLFTGGQDVKLKEQQKAIAVTDEGVMMFDK